MTKETVSAATREQIYREALEHIGITDYRDPGTARDIAIEALQRALDVPATSVHPEAQTPATGKPIAFSDSSASSGADPVTYYVPIVNW